MIKGTTQIRIRYGETDRMNYAYYGNYALYYEVGRAELLRSFGMDYSELEAKGVILPVMNMHIDYFKPAVYDELITITTYVHQLPKASIKFDYEIYNSENILINKGYTTLVFVDKNTKKPMRAPQYFLDLFKDHF
ncbi:MAG: acyl-CoA thioesterase [Bacteroidales bacterium]|nr:acyl-CoA thioesterase [Bacteroidales bacterium]